MIKALVNWFSAAPIVDCETHQADVFTTPHKTISKNVQVLSSYYGTGDAYNKKIAARVSPSVLNGDTLFMFISGYHKTPHPYGFKKILETEAAGDLYLKVCYKSWQAGDPLRFEVPISDETFVSLITLRGTNHILDARGRINNACSVGSKIVTPRVNTHKDGAIITCFAYDDPNSMHIKDQETLASLECCNRGMAIGISPTGGGLSRRMSAVSESLCGGGDDIALCVAIY